jgi:hypothetical protein
LPLLGEEKKAIADLAIFMGSGSNHVIFFPLCSKNSAGGALSRYFVGNSAFMLANVFPNPQGGSIKGKLC